MEKLKKARLIWLSLGIFAAVSGLLSIPAIVLTALDASWLLMSLSVAAFAHGAYGVSFYFTAAAKCGVMLKSREHTAAQE